MTIQIDVRPGNRPGLYTAALTGRDLNTSRQPFLDAARVLLAEGLDPHAIAPSGTESLRVPVGVAAKLTVWEPDKGRPYFAKWKPRISSVVAPIAPIERGATPAPSAVTERVP